MSRNYVCYQGEFFSKDQAFLGMNRALQYGDGFFETIRANNGKLNLSNYHLERIQFTAQKLKIEIDPDLLKEFETAMVETLAVNGLAGHARLRLTVYRGGKGRYLPTSNRANYLIEAEELSEGYQLNPRGLKLELAESVRIHPNFFSNLKSISAEIYVRAALEKQERKYDDLILLNVDDHLVESCDSNLFLRKGQQIYTPPLSSGAISGVMRKFLLENLPKLGFETIETELRIPELESADEIFLSNAIRGVKWVGSYGSKRYFKNCSEKIIAMLNERFSD